MKTFKSLLLIALVAIFTFDGLAQDESKAGAITRRRAGETRREKQSTGPNITQRMESFYEYTPVSDADLTWMRVIYRSLDLSKEKNMALYYPEESTENQENLFRIIMRLLANDQLAAYEYLDGREVFTEQYKIKVKDMLDRFHILYTEAKGSSEKHPRFSIEESDVPANEVLSYYVLERWEFDRVNNRMKQRVEAICPVLHRSGDFGGEAVRYPMFWVKFDALRPALSQQYIFTDDDHNPPKPSRHDSFTLPMSARETQTTPTLDDYFNLGMSGGEIYRTRNLQNKSMMQLYPDPDDMKRAQDSIDNRLHTFDKHLWVPTREELQAAAEAREEAEAKANEIESRDGSDASDDKAEVKESRSARGNKSATKSTKKKKTTKVKQPKVKTNNSSSAARSVRRRK